jgi:hypothetical protein
MESFEHLLHQLHLSYLQARKNKRNTHNQLKFEMHQETQLYDLAKEIYEHIYAQTLYRIHHSQTCNERDFCC